MAYADEVKEVAFSLYVADKSFDEIASELQVRKKTIIRWKNKYGWEARKEKIREETREKLDRKRVDLLTRITMEADDLREELFEALKIAASKKVSFASGVNAYVTITKFLTDILAEKRKAKWGGNVEEVVSIIMKVFSQDEVIGPLLEQRKEKIINAIEEEFTKAESANPS